MAAAGHADASAEALANFFEQQASVSRSYAQQSNLTGASDYAGTNNIMQAHSKSELTSPHHPDSTSMSRLHQHGSHTSLDEHLLFSSSIGTESGLAQPESSDSGLGSCGLANASNGSLDQLVAEQPSRTLFVKNVGSTVADDDILALFQAHGEVRTLYTACKHRGFVTVTFFDLRAAMAARAQLHGTSLGPHSLEVLFSLPKQASEDSCLNQGTIALYNLDPNTSNDQLAWIFAKFGEVKDIRDSPARPNHKFIEFYDVRHAATALHAMNRAEHSHKVPGALALAAGEGPQPPAADLKELAGLVAPPQVSLNDPQASLLGTSPGSAAWEPRSGSGSESSLYQLFSHGGNSNTNSGSSGPGSSQQAYQQAASASHSALQQLLAQQAAAGGDTGMKLVDAAQQLLGSRGMHVSDSASSIGGSQQAALFGGNASIASQLQSLAQFTGGDKSAGSGLDGLFQGGSDAAALQQLLAANGLAGLNLSDPSAANLLLGMGMANGAGGGGDLWGSPMAGSGGIPASWPGAGSMQQQQFGMAMADQLLQQQAQAQQQQLALQLAQLQAQAMGLAALPSSQLLQSAAAANLNQQALMRALMPSAGGNPNALASAAQLLQHAQLSAQLAGSLPGFRPGQYGVSPSSREQRGGRLSRRVTDPALEAERKAQQEKLFALDGERIMSGEDKRTTLMVKNIPNKYTQKMLLAAVEEHFKGMFDFFYLPIDFKNKCNVGYAFINITKPAFIIPFIERFHNRKWERFNSEKVCHITYARIQGKAALVSHFQNSSLMNEDKRCRPMLFVSEGPSQGEPEPFPVGPSVKPRAPHVAGFAANARGR